MTPYFIYARKSSESEDRQALSIESQLRELTEYAKRNDLNITKTFTESQSAKRSGRPQFMAMMKAIRQSKGAAVLCWKLDRLTRNLHDAAIISEALESGILSLIRTPHQEYRNSSSDLFMSGLEFLMGKKYVDDLSENVTRGMRTKVRAGWFPGRAPLGYVNDSTPGKGLSVIRKDPERFTLVRKMWDLMLTGRYSVPRILSIATNNWGLRIRPHRSSPTQRLSRTNAYKMFQNPFYYGQFRYKGEICLGKHDPMITESEFQRVQELLGRSNRERPKRHVFAFTGMIRCGQCGAIVTAERRTKFIRSTGEKRRYVYYHCTHRKDSSCKQRSITEKELKATVNSFLSRIFLPKEYLEWLFRHLDKVADQERVKTSATTRSMDSAIAAAERRLDNLFALKLSPDNRDGNMLSDTEFVAQKNRLTKEIADLKSKQQIASSAEENSIKLTKATFRFAAYAKHWLTHGTPDQQRAVFNGVGSNHTLTNKTLRFSAQKPLQVLERGLSLYDPYNLRFEPQKMGQDYRKPAPLEDGLCSWWT